MKNKQKICVYTCIMGDYEQINDQELFKTEADFICFTDNKQLKSKTWKIVHIEPILYGDFTRSQRLIKLRPHLYLSNYDIAIYIDNSVILNKSPEEICELTKISDFDMAICYHSERETLLDEFLLVALLKYDSIDIIYGQLMHYLEYFPNVLSRKPFWGGFFVVNLNCRSIQEFFDIWSSYVLRYSKRDQLSVNISLLKSQLNVNILEYNNNISPFHSWPNIKGRKQNKVAYLRNAYSLQELSDVVLSIREGDGSEGGKFVSSYKNIIYGNLFVGSGSNTTGSGGQIDFGIEELSLGLPMSSIKSNLINANLETSETQGDLEFLTRKVDGVSSELNKRFIIRENGIINFVPVNINNYSPIKGDMYIDTNTECIRFCLKDGEWRHILFE